jgi:hypothetical protein
MSEKVIELANAPGTEASSNLQAARLPFLDIRWIKAL